MRLLLLNLNYLRYHFFIKTLRKKLWILNTLPSGLIHYIVLFRRQNPINRCAVVFYVRRLFFVILFCLLCFFLVTKELT